MCDTLLQMPENEATPKQNNVTQLELPKDWPSGRIIQLSHEKERLFIMKAEIYTFLGIVFWLSWFCFWQPYAFKAEARELQT